MLVTASMCPRLVFLQIWPDRFPARGRFAPYSESGELARRNCLRRKRMSQSRTLRVTQQLQSPGMRLARTARNFVVLAAISRSFAQSPPVSAGRPWHWSEEQKTMRDSLRFHPLTVRIDSGKLYSLAELIDLAEAQSPATRVTWEKARAQAASIGIARSELFPTLSAVAMAGVVRQE